jgi:hypothetical protein
MNARRIAIAVSLLGLFWASTAAAQVAANLDDRSWHISAQLDASALTLEDDVLDQEGAAFLGGLGVTARLDFPLRAAVEVGFSGVHRESQNGVVNESVFVQSISGLWYFSRAPKHRFYARIGSSTLHTQRRIGEQEYEFLESGLHFGGGVDFLLGENFLISVDARVMGLASGEYEGEHHGPVRQQERGSHPTGWTESPETRGGSRASVAVGYRW